MSKRTKKWLSLIMTFIMIAVSVPLPELKVHAATDYGVWIGDTQFTSEKTIIDGTVKGSAIYNDSTKTLIFDNFEGVSGRYKGSSNIDYLLYSEHDITVTGKAVLDAEYETGEEFLYGFGYAGNVTIDKDADLTVAVPDYAVYSSVSAKTLDVYGKLDLTAHGSNFRDAINVDKVVLNDGCNVKAVADGTWSSAIRATEINIEGGDITAISDKDESTAIYAKNIIINGGNINASAGGVNGSAIGDNTYTENITINGGDITAEGGLYAIHAEKGITLNSRMYFKDPVGGKLSSDNKNVVDKSNEIIKSVHLVKAKSYELWVGNTEVNSENCKDIPGILGGGSASYDPESQTLTFSGNVTGVEELCTNYGSSAYIYNAWDLTIEGDASFDDPNAEMGIQAGGTAASLTIKGNIAVKAKKQALWSMMKLAILGKVDAESTAYDANNAVMAETILIDDGELKVSGNMDSGNVLIANRDLIMYSGSLSVNSLTKSSSADVNSINCKNDLIMYGGRLWAENDHGYAVYADNNIEINGGQTDLKGSSSGAVTLLASNNIKFSGGNINIDSEENIAVQTNNIEISDAQIAIKSKKTGIEATGSFTMDSGVLDIVSEEEQAIRAAVGVTLNTVEVTFPENGKVVGTTVTEEDGTTPAKQVQIKGTVSYPVWIGDTRITAENKDNIELVGGSATYDDITGTLTFTGDVTGINGAYELSGSNKAKIFSADMKGLTISGNASIKDTEAEVGIMSEGGKLTIKGNIEVYGSKSAVHTVKDLSIKGKLTAESADGFAVRSQNNIILEGEGLYAKNTSATAQAVLSDEKLIINSGIFEAESGFAAVEATGGIKAAEGFDITYPDHSRYSTDNKTIEAFDSELGYITAKKVRIEKRDRYGLYIGGLEVTSLNKDNVPGLKSGSASYNEVTKTLVFKGDDAEIDAFLGEYSAGIFSEDELNIEGNVRIDLFDKADHAIRTEGALTISGTVTANSDKYTVWAEDADLLVSGELKASGEKAAVVTNKLTVDGGSISANVADSISNVIDAKGDVELISGSITAVNGGNNKANGITAGGKVTVKDGNMLIIKTDKSGYGLRSGSAGITVEGGNLDIICKDSGHGIEESFLCIKGGTVNLETEAFSSNGYYSKDGNDINVFGGTLNVKSRLTPAVLCRKFVTGLGNVNISSGNKGINCALFTQDGGSVNIEAGDTAIDTEYFDMKSGKLTAVNKAGNGKAAIRSQTEIELGEEIAIIEPEGGKKAQVVPEAPDPAFYTIVDNGDIAADSVKLYAPSKYNVWVGSTQVTDTNKDDIEGVKGGKASYDPDSKTLIFTGDVTGVTGLDPEFKAQIYAKDQDLTISGNAVLTDDTSEFGIRVQGINLCINGDIQAYGKYAGIYATDNIMIDGNVTACGSFKEAAVDSYAGDIFLNSGKLTAQAAGADGLAAVIGDDIFLSSGEFTAVHENKAALIANTCTINDVTAEISGFKGIDVSHLTINGGDVYVNAKDVAVSSAYEFNMNGGKLKAVTEGEKAVFANGGITIAATHKISEPEGGKLSPDGTTIVDEADAPAKSVTIEKDASVIDPDEENLWNLFTETEFSYEISALNAGTEVSNLNKKSGNFYDAKLNGSTISVTLKSNVDRKKAAKPANTILEFKLDDGSAVTYVMPVQYVKPVFRLNVNSATIKDGTETELKTRLLYKTKAGVFEPYDLSTADIKYGSQDAVGDNEGYISFTASAAGKGIKLSVKEEEWEKAIELKFNVKAVKKDVLSVDLDGAKAVLLNTNTPAQKYTYDVKLNGKTVTAEDNVKASCKKADGIAMINSENKLEIALPANAKKGSYTVVLESGSGAKTSVKVKVSDKSFDRAVVMKIRSKYDVVTGQKMVVVPVFKDAQTELIDVSSLTADISAELNDAGNIEIEYTGTALNAKNLKMGNIELKLELDGMDDQKITLKNVKAKKSTPKVKAGAVNLTTTAAGEIKGSVNIISTCKDGSGKLRNITPTEVKIVNKKKAEADVNAADKTEIDIKSMDAKSGSLKVQLTYQGGVTKKVTIKIKKK